MSPLPLLLGLLFAAAQSPVFDDETAQHLAAMKARLDDRSTDVETRESLALETAATLDRSARAEPSFEGKLGRWDAAVDLLDEFDRKNEGHPRRREFGLQSAVYRWAQARAWNDRRAIRPADVPSTVEEAAKLDEAIARLRRILGGEPGPLTDNIRFRLAWALTDRAALEAAGAPLAQLRRDEAMGLLSTPPSEASLSGFHALLKAELLREAGRLDEAASQVAVAARAAAPPPETELLDVLLPILMDRRAFAEARKAIDAMGLPAPTKGLNRVRVDIEEWKAAEPGAGGSERRRSAEVDLLDQIHALQASKAAEARVAVSEVAASGLAFDPDAAAGLWDVVAEGFDVRGDPKSASMASEKAAERQARDGRREEAGAARLRAGGYAYQAGDFARADALLEAVVADPESGGSRPRASLLQAIARGREAATGAAPTRERYEQALARHLKAFPDDPTSAEARWMMGNLEQARGNAEKAQGLWKAISIESPRWAQARVAACDALRLALEDRIAADEREGLEKDYEAARSLILESSRDARERLESDRADLLICQARLDLLPIVGKPPRAREAAEECLAMNLKPSQRYRARLARLVALATSGRYVEAEREAQQHRSWSDPEDRAALLEAVRQLDLAAAAAEADLPQRRFGQVARVLIAPLLQDAELPDALRNELTFRLARAQLFQGDPRSAQATLQSWAPSTSRADDRFLRDLADAYTRLYANEMAIDVQRLRLQKAASGSRPWFDARYGLALAYYRLGRKSDASQLVEATAILHPELGGGRLREKFIRLRQRLGSSP